MFQELDLFYRGVILGIMIAAPVGPIGLLCIRRTLNKGMLIGLATGLGAAFADTIFSAVAALGVAAIMDFIRHYAMGLRIAGGGMLLYGAWRGWHDKPQPPADPIALVKRVIGFASDKSFWRVAKACLSSFALTMTNPVTILAVLAVVATFGHVETHLDACTLVFGIFIGSVLWWFMLAGGITLVRGHFTESRITIVNRVTASILAALAVWAIVGAMIELIHHLRNLPA